MQAHAESPGMARRQSDSSITEDGSLPTSSSTSINSTPGDLSTAAALRAQYAIEIPKPTRRRHKKAAPAQVVEDEVEPLVDLTLKLQLHSKKTERLQKKQQKRAQHAAESQSLSRSMLDLPSEILTEILSCLRPSDIFRLLRTSHSVRDFILNNEHIIARDILRRRYWTLYRCFPVPVTFRDVPEDTQVILLSSKRQEMLSIHRKSYHQHIQMLDPRVICTCMTCVFAWNNLCLVVDLNHWQHNLEHREPIPVISRGANPEWNQNLLSKNAKIVLEAMERPLIHAWILEKHLETITQTILRFWRWKKKGESNATLHAKPRLYRMTDKDVEGGDDDFLERSGPPSYDFPFHRDNYYSLEAYLPNRKWSQETRRWYYYALPPTQHERDIEWMRSWARGSSSSSSSGNK